MAAASKGAQAARAEHPAAAQQVANDFQDISLTFRHFFTRKVMLVKYPSAWVVLSGGFGTLDELAETLNLVAQHRRRRGYGR